MESNLDSQPERLGQMTGISDKGVSQTSMSETVNKCVCTYIDKDRLMGVASEAVHAPKPLC